jgi:N-acyl-D-aspartate/D-glutamate deacylase
VLLTALALGVFLFARVTVGAQATAPSYDLLITNARVVDGSGNPWFRADVAIKDGRIARIFDENTIIDQATFDKPHQYPLGISYVIVNGAPVIDNNQLTAVRSGVALRGAGFLGESRRDLVGAEFALYEGPRGSL